MHPVRVNRTGNHIDYDLCALLKSHKKRRNQLSLCVQKKYTILDLSSRVYFTHQRCSAPPDGRWAAWSRSGTRRCPCPSSGRTECAASTPRCAANALPRSAGPTCTCNDRPSAGGCRGGAPTIPAMTRWNYIYIYI